jgi:hypothetical protein
MEGTESGPIGEVTTERVRSADGETKEARLAVSACKTASVMLIALFWEEGRQGAETRDQGPETGDLKLETA